MDELLQEFLSETGEHLDTVDRELVRFEQEPNNTDILRNIFRLVHTVKGTCGFIGLPRLEALTHAAESVMGQFRDGASVSMEGFTHLIPHAAGHEAIRQGRKRLTLIRMTPDLIYDQMIGMGMVRKIVFSYLGNPGVGLLRRAAGRSDAVRRLFQQAGEQPLELTRMRGEHVIHVEHRAQLLGIVAEDRDGVGVYD